MSDEIICAGGCKISMPDADAAGRAGWGFLHITGRYRCGACERDLYRASTIEGAPPRNDVDQLPPDSIGALKALPKPEPLREKVK